MKIYYYVDSITDNVYVPCEHNKCNIGSATCQECKYCYGRSSDKYYDLIGYAGKEHSNLKIHYGHYIDCSKMFNKPPMSVKIKRFFYHIKLGIKNLCEEMKYLIDEYGIKPKF